MDDDYDNGIGCSLDCPVCLESYDDLEHLPKMMSCLHTVCVSCILHMEGVKTDGAATSQVSATPSDDPLDHYVASAPLYESASSTPAEEQVSEEGRLTRESIQTRFEEFLRQLNTVVPNVPASTTSTTASTTSTTANNTSTTANNTSTTANNNSMTVRFGNIILSTRHSRLMEELRRRQNDVGNRTPPSRLPSLQALRQSSSVFRPAVSPPTPPRNHVNRVSTVSFSEVPPRPPRCNINSGASVLVSKVQPSPSLAQKPFAVPKDKSFLCPLCRNSVQTNSLQTNRYIIAHLHDLKKLKKRSMTISDDPVEHQQQEQQEQGAVLAETWCTVCCDPAQAGCVDHDRMALTEWTARQFLNVQEGAQQLQQRTQQQRDGLFSLQTQALELQACLGQVISKLDGGLTQCKHLEKVLNEIEKDNDPLKLTETQPQALKQRALELKNQTKLLYDLRTQITRLEGGADVEGGKGDSVMIWQGDSKLYIKTEAGTFSIMKQGAEYAS